MILRLFCLLSLLFAFAASAIAAEAPEIKLRGDGELGAYKTKGLSIEHLGLAVDIRSGLAQVSLTATLRNEKNEPAEARFSYPLPDGAVINGYALDLDGTLVDGVLMPKERAETLYTDRVTASVDPGIAARTADNRYQTRIYPIAGEGGRRQIRLDFAVPVPASGLRLPLSQSRAIEHVTVKISGDGAQEARSPIAGINARNVKLSGDVFIPAIANKPALSTYARQRFLTLPLTAQNNRIVEDVSSVAILWDSSLSREAGKQSVERRFIRKVLTQLAPQTQSLVHGAQKIDFAARYDTPSQLVSALSRLSYDGATNLPALLNEYTRSRSDNLPDICLLITDGHSTVGAGELPNLPCRVFTFSADKNPNTDWLALIAARNAGADLSGLGADEAARRIIAGSGPQLASGQRGDIFRAGARQWLILPIDRDAQSVEVEFKTETKQFNFLQLETAAHPAAGSIWGQRQIAKRQTRGPQSFEAVLKASRRWNVQTKETAFLVLENAQDYIEAKIDPPQNFPADRLATYKDQRAEMRKEEAEELAEHLDDLREAWESQIAWWETDWDDLSDTDKRGNSMSPQPAMLAPSPVPQADFTCWDGTSVFSAAQCPAQSATAAAPQTPEVDYIVTTGSRIQQDEVVVTSRRESRSAKEPSSAITIETRAWSPERPFLKALKGLAPEAFEFEYIKQRKSHGDQPSFYLEIADQLHRDGQTARATLMAVTALDLQTATPVTRNNVADRLLMYGQTEDAIALYRDVLPGSKDRPQPFYNLALALIQAGDDAKGGARETFYREAFEHLIHVIQSPWEDDYEGIHLIALQDLNRTLARLPERSRRQLQTELGLDSVFYKNLPVDIRILMDWTHNDADLDMHVIERVGAADEEKAYYRNPATALGGRVSNDMTEGYGPEEYLIRRAPNGLYRVESDYFAQDNYTQDGALKLRARLWRHYGREDETFQTVIIEMLEEKEDAYILGNIQVGAKSGMAVAASDKTE